jgi:hypothetical protein
MAGAGRVIPPGGVVYLYGAYKENGVTPLRAMKPSTRDLRRRNPEWGVRHLEEVAELAEAHGLELIERIAMPANNLSLVFQRP